MDRRGLNLTHSDTVLVITSGGCNALAYALDEPKQVFAVDLNFRQNALLELKLAGIKHLQFADFFDFFGYGYSKAARRIYRSSLRDALGDQAKGYWDRHISDFSSQRRPFYLRGGIGTGAWLFKSYVDNVARLRPSFDRLFASTSLEQQLLVYRDELQSQFWTLPIRWSLNRDTMLAFAGIPSGQLKLAREHIKDIAEHMDQCALKVLGQVSLRENHFWYLYVHGAYSHDCCPSYLQPENFERLKAGLANRISVHSSTIAEFLASHREPISSFALLDHFDWFYMKDKTMLANEWQAIIDRAHPGARFVWRSMGKRTNFIDNTEIQRDGKTVRVGELLNYDHDLAARLKQHERVNAYSSLTIANLRDRG